MYVFVAKLIEHKYTFPFAVKQKKEVLLSCTISTMLLIVNLCSVLSGSKYDTEFSSILKPFF